ncbi:MAG: DUF3644 domain-containing protein [Nanoarchaeota archaeon]
MRKPRLTIKVNNLIKKARESSILAVNVYNNPTTQFRTSAYIVLMNIAWTSLFQAIYERRGIKYYYKDPKDRRKYLQIDGEPKTWDLSKCANEYFKDGDNPAFQNINFFVGLRNKIEHNYVPKLDPYIFGECQSYLINFEEMLVQNFGKHYAIADTLLFALQYSRIRTDEQLEAIKSVQVKNFREIKDYVDNFRKNLDVSISSDPRYSFRVFLVPKIGNRITSSDIAVEFVKFDPTNPEHIKKCDYISTIIKEKKVFDKSEILLKLGVNADEKLQEVMLVKDNGDTRLPRVGITRDPQKASGIYVMEKLSEKVFEDASKLVEAGHILDQRFKECPFSKKTIYFIYSNRLVIQDEHAPQLMLKYSLEKYSPFLYWLLKVDRTTINTFFENVLTQNNYNHILAIIRLFVATQHEEGLKRIINMAKTIKDHTQKPAWYWSLNKMLKKNGTLQPIYSALDMNPSQEICGERIDYLLNNLEEANKLLSKLCLDFSKHENLDNLLIRKLDFIVHSKDLSNFLAFKESLVHQKI